jgi:protein PhnA
MSLDLSSRSSNKCELCGSDDHLSNFSLDSSENEDMNVHVCSKCLGEIETKEFSDHFRCLSGSMWSEHLPVQILTYRILSMMSEIPWASDFLSQMYLDDDALAIAEIGLNVSMTVDSNKAELKEGDDVTLIKDLVVKGANFTAKRGTMVRGIRLSDNPLHIEGKVNGTKIVIISDFVKKV